MAGPTPFSPFLQLQTDVIWDRQKVSYSHMMTTVNTKAGPGGREDKKNRKKGHISKLSASEFWVTREQEMSADDTVGWVLFLGVKGLHSEYSLSGQHHMSTPAVRPLWHFTPGKLRRSRTGFVHLDISVIFRAVRCILGCWAAFRASSQQMLPVTLSQLWQPQNIFRHCQKAPQRDKAVLHGLPSIEKNSGEDCTLQVRISRTVKKKKNLWQCIWYFALELQKASILSKKYSF